MRGVFRISEAVSLGMHAAAYLARAKGGLSSTPAIARALKVSEAHLIKVMQHLSRAGLVRSVRGPLGGFTLARTSRQITLLDIYQALEGPFGFPTCLLGKQKCRSRRCIFGTLPSAVNTMVYRSFSRTTLYHLKNSFAPRTRSGSRTAAKRRRR